MSKPLKWKKSNAVPTEFYERDASDRYHGDVIRDAPGIACGPLGVSNSTYGWRVVHLASKHLVHRGVSFRTRRQAKQYAEGLLSLPGVLDAFERHATALGTFTHDVSQQTLDAIATYSKEWNPDSPRWKEADRASG